MLANDTSAESHCMDPPENIAASIECESLQRVSTVVQNVCESGHRVRIISVCIRRGILVGTPSWAMNPTRGDHKQVAHQQRAVPPTFSCTYCELPASPAPRSGTAWQVRPTSYEMPTIAAYAPTHRWVLGAGGAARAAVCGAQRRGERARNGLGRWTERPRTRGSLPKGDAGTSASDAIAPFSSQKGHHGCSSHAAGRGRDAVSAPHPRVSKRRGEQGQRWPLYSPQRARVARPRPACAACGPFGEAAPDGGVCIREEARAAANRSE